MQHWQQVNEHIHVNEELGISLHWMPLTETWVSRYKGKYNYAAASKILDEAKELVIKNYNLTWSKCK